MIRYCRALTWSAAPVLVPVSACGGQADSADAGADDVPAPIAESTATITRRWGRSTADRLRGQRLPGLAAPTIERAEIEGVSVPLADIDTLIRSKRTDRFQDRANVESLERVKRLARGE